MVIRIAFGILFQYSNRNESVNPEIQWYTPWMFLWFCADFSSSTNRSLPHFLSVCVFAVFYLFKKCTSHAFNTEFIFFSLIVETIRSMLPFSLLFSSFIVLSNKILSGPECCLRMINRRILYTSVIIMRVIVQIGQNARKSEKNDHAFIRILIVSMHKRARRVSDSKGMHKKH